MKAKAEADEYQVSATFTLHNKPANPLWQWTQVPQVEVTAYAMLPSTSVIKFTLGAPSLLIATCEWATHRRLYQKSAGALSFECLYLHV